MDWEGIERENDHGIPLPIEKEMALMHTIFSYFQDSEIKGTLANLGIGDLDLEWIDVSALMKFKKISDLISNSFHLADIIIKHASLYFQVSADCQKLKRIRSYDWDQVKKESLGISICNTLAISVSGFSTVATEEEVKIFLESKCGTLSGFSRDLNEYGIWNIQFDKFDDLLNAMSLNLEYQDSRIKFRCKSLNNQVSNLYKGVKTNSGISFTPNRILEFKKDGDKIIDKSRLVKIFEEYALVVTIDFDGSSSGYVRLKKPVANQVVDVINRNGGLSLNDQVLEVCALQGNEERVYWEIYGSKPIISKVPIIPIKKNGLKRHAGISSHLRKDTSLNKKSGSCILKKSKKRKASLNKVRINDLLDSISQL